MWGSYRWEPQARFVRDYASARRFHDSIEPLRTSGLRPIGARRTDNSWLVHADDDAVHFRLYRTDVVTYHEDGDVTVRGYPSQQTATFFDNVGPLGMCYLAAGAVQFSHGGQDMFVLNTYDTIRFTPDGGGWVLHDPDKVTPAVIKTPDRKACRALLKGLRWDEFVAYARMRTAMNSLPELSWLATPTRAAEYVEEGDWDAAYVALCVRASGGRVYPPQDSHFESVRKCLYRRHDVFTTTSHTVMTADQYRRYRNAEKSWG